MTVEEKQKKKDVFEGSSAWFSESVAPEWIETFVNVGGVVKKSHEDADLLFSEDAARKDTRHFYATPEYLSEDLTIFHPKYIGFCVEQESRENVDLMNFVVPSERVLKELKEVDLLPTYDSPHEPDPECLVLRIGMQRNDASFANSVVEVPDAIQDEFTRVNGEG